MFIGKRRCEGVDPLYVSCCGLEIILAKISMQGRRARSGEKDDILIASASGKLEVIAGLF